MADVSGLVLRSGDSAGLVVPFKLPVLTLGSGSTADVQCADLDAVHCLLMPTPAGPVLRNFSDNATWLNGNPVLAALLHDGDVLKVGSSEFAVHWPEIVPLTVSNEPSETEQKRIQADHAALAAERESVAAARDEMTKFAESLATQHKQQEEYRTQLHQEWETLNAAKAELHAKVEAIGEEHRKATEVHQQAHVDAAQHLREQRAIIESERAILQGQQAELESQRAEHRGHHQHLQDEARRMEAESQRIANEVNVTNNRIKQAWGELQAAHQKFEEDRLQFETEYTAKANTLKAHEADLSKREASLQPRVTAAENRLNVLHAEIAGLEQRTTQARTVLADLEAKRDSVRPTMNSRMSAVMDDWNTPVPLTPQRDSRSTNDLMTALHQQEQEMAKERQKLYLALRTAAAEREAIHDRALRLAEERQRLEASQQQWQMAEEQTVSELEHLAMTLSQRESRLMAMEKTWTTANQVGTRLGY